MMDFTNDEMNLMCIYSGGGDRSKLIAKLKDMRAYLETDEKELMDLTESTLLKLGRMTDDEFEALELIPDFDF